MGSDNLLYLQYFLNTFLVSLWYLYFRELLLTFILVCHMTIFKKILILIVFEPTFNIQLINSNTTYKKTHSQVVFTFN